MRVCYYQTIFLIPFIIIPYKTFVLYSLYSFNKSIIRFIPYFHDFLDTDTEHSCLSEKLRQLLAFEVLLLTFEQFLLSVGTDEIAYATLLTDSFLA